MWKRSQRTGRPFLTLARPLLPRILTFGVVAVVSRGRTSKASLGASSVVPGPRGRPSCSRLLLSESLVFAVNAARATAASGGTARPFSQNRARPRVTCADNGVKVLRHQRDVDSHAALNSSSGKGAAGPIGVSSVLGAAWFNPRPLTKLSYSWRTRCASDSLS